MLSPFERSLYSSTVKYFRLAIAHFLPIIRDLKRKDLDPETIEKLSDLEEFYIETARKIDAYNLNLEDPNRIYEKEPDEISLDSLILNDKKIINLVQLTMRMLNEWKARFKRIQSNEFITEKQRDEIFQLNKQINTLEIFFSNGQFIFFKYKEHGPIVFPGEEVNKKKDEVIVQKVQKIFPEEVITKLPSDVQKICNEFNDIFEMKKPIAGMLLLRRLLPLSIVRKFQKDNQENEIMKKGEYLDTRALLGKVEKKLREKRIYKDIINYKKLIDSSQHSYSVNIQQEDVLGAGITLRTFLEQLYL